MNKMTLAAVMLAATGLTACSDDSTSEAFCAAFANDSTYTLSCNDGCTVPANYSAAHDGDLDTAVAIAPVAGKTTATITLVVENGATGVDLQAGSVTGVFVTRPASGTHGTAITTYHNGTGPVDNSVVADQQVVQSVESGSGAGTFLGLITNDPFDEVRFVTSYDWNSDANAPTYFLYEVCSSGGNT